MVYMVTAAQKQELAEIVVLLEEIDRFYGASEFDDIEHRSRQAETALFSNPPWAYALLAREGSNLAGIATYSFLWPASDLKRSLYLKELYVSEAHRSRGVGSLLMRELIAIASQTECSRVEWTTDSDNPSAQKFYESLGFAKLPSKMFYRLDGFSEDSGEK